MQPKRHLIFHVAWRGVNLLLVAVVVSSLFAGVREYSVRRYLERESFLYLALSVAALLFLLLLRAVLTWHADSRLRIPRFHLREHAFFSAPEIKQ